MFSVMTSVISSAPLMTVVVLAISDALSTRFGSPGVGAALLCHAPLSSRQ